MRLKYEHFDGPCRVHRTITDENTGKVVGDIEATDNVSGGGIDVSLFGGKYRTTVHSYQECWGFVKGVEAVLDHMTSLVRLVPKPLDAAEPKGMQMLSKRKRA